MPYVPNPAHRLGIDGGKPLAERYAAVRALAIREIPVTDPERSVINSMVSEQSIDLMYSAIERAMKRKAPAEPSPQLRAEWDALSELARNYNSACIEIKDAQKFL